MHSLTALLKDMLTVLLPAPNPIRPPGGKAASDAKINAGECIAAQTETTKLVEETSQIILKLSESAGEYVTSYFIGGFSC